MGSDSQIKYRYCFDSDAFITNWKRYFISTFQPFWEEIGQKIEGGSIFIHEEVMNEVTRGSDGLVDWIKSYRDKVVSIDSEQIEFVKQIVKKYPRASKYKQLGPHHADPFLVAFAQKEGLTVVSYEERNNSEVDPKLPNLCDEYGVEFFSMEDFFIREGWQFVPTKVPSLPHRATATTRESTD